MSRKSNLIHEYKKACQNIRQGSYATCQNRLAILKALTEELILLHHAPNHWDEITHEQIIKLIYYWQKKRIKTETIATRISALRMVYAYFNKEETFPTNKALGIKIWKKTDKLSLQTIFVNSKVSHPIIQTVMDFEIHFGLTKSESIKLPVYSIEPDHLKIYRDIAYNSYDRIIPIANEKQKQCIKRRNEVLKQYNKNDSLLQITSFGNISALYRIELAIVGIAGHSHLRQIYAKDRYKVLSILFSAQESMKKLQVEMGLSSNRLLKSWIQVDL